MMRKILFIIPEYSHGGTNKSLENMLSLIDKTKYDISIYCLYEDGRDYYKRVFEPYILKKSHLYYWLHDNKLSRKLIGFYNKLTKRDNFDWLYKRESRWLQRKHHFDVVIGYQEGIATLFVSHFENCKKIVWIHCDYGAWAGNEQHKNNETIYPLSDSIVCVSECARQSFTNLFPELRAKTFAIYNIINVKNCKKEDWGNLYNDHAFHLISVGRLDGVKQYEKIPSLVNRIRKKTNRPFQWYIIGNGASEPEIITEIQKYSVHDKVILLGAKDNPYPYMQQADVVVCTSHSESFSYVIAEAKALHTPVISNNFPVAYEVVDEQTGWVVPLDDMPQLIVRLINDENGEYSRKKESIISYEYSNKEILKQIDELLEN